MKAFKLTDGNNQTYNYCQWGENVTHETKGAGDLCSEGWIHYYRNKYLAVIFNSIHGNYDPKTMHMWQGIATREFKHDKGLKSGCIHFTTTKQIEVPQITIEQRVKFAIYCTLYVYKEKSFITWANNWLVNKNRTASAASAAWTAAENAAESTASTASAAKNAAARAAASAAENAAESTASAAKDVAASVAASAASAASAIESAAGKAKINFVSIIMGVINGEALGKL